MDFQLPAGENFPESEIARLALELLVIFMHLTAAFRAARVDGAEVAGNRIVLEVFRLPDDVLGHLDDARHKLLAREFALLHERQFLFPFGRQLGGIQLGNTEAMQRDHQRRRLGGRNKFATFAVYIFFVNETFDDRRPCGRRAEAFFLHRRPKLLVVDHLSRTLHRGEQGRLREARRRFGLVGDRFDFNRLDLLLGLDRG